MEDTVNRANGNFCLFGNVLYPYLFICFDNILKFKRLLIRFIVLKYKTKEIFQIIVFVHGKFLDYMF
jgi:hypothetical protein